MVGEASQPRARVITTHPAPAPAARPVALAPPRRVRLSRGAFRALAWVLAASVVVQVFLAGAAVMGSPSFWVLHTSFVHAFELLPVVLGVLAFLGKGTRLLIGLSLLGFVLISLQYAFLAARPSPVAGLHVVNALAIFGLAVMLAVVAARPPLPAGARGVGWRNA